MTSPDIAAVAGKLQPEQESLLLRYAGTLERQPITEAECFHTGCELFVEMRPEEYDAEYGTMIDPGEKAWFASMGALSSEGSSEWDECWIQYNGTGLALRQHLLENGGG